MADAVDWHGWKFGKDGMTVHIGRLPTGKPGNFYLSIETPYKIQTLARFYSEEDARAAQAIFDGIADRMNSMKREQQP